MVSRVNIGWRSDKTLVECMLYMLDNEISTDVCFEVGPPDGATVNIRAHKLILAARSSVFEAMFSSGMTECRSGKDENIRIEDIDADIFKVFLRYMYSDSVEISSETALALLYAAKKYMLPKLSEECSCLLQKSVKVENVCFLLDQSLLFSDGKLRENCLDFFSSNSDKILSSAEFLDCSRQAMDAILKIEKMKSKESVVFQNCVNWAKHQLRRHTFIENPSDEQIRETLGSLLYDFHFPTMELTEFADLVGRGNVLTGEEKSAIYYYLIRKQKPEFLPFRTNGRHPLEKFLEKMVDRTITVKQAVWQYESCKDGIDFRADADIQLSGLGLFSGIDRKQYNVDVEVLHIQESLCKKRFTIPFTGNSTPFKISFDSPIPLRAGLIYTIAAYAHGIIGYYGDSCKVICESDNITFTFSRYAGTESSGDEFRGQIPQLYFL